MKNINIKLGLTILIYLLVALSVIFIIKLLKITGICCLIISILSPLFFGYIIYWILFPLIEKIKFNKVLSTSILYILIVLMLFLILINIIPLIIKDIKDIIPTIRYYIYHNRLLYKIYINLNMKNIISTSIKKMNYCINNIFSIVINIIYSFIFGFFFLISKKKRNYFKFIPNKLKNNISKDLRLYLKSILIDTIFMFISFTVSFYFIGLPSPLLFSFFCSITNIIPYFGPYIGGIPAILIALTKSFKLGLIITITIIVVQIIENSIIQPIIVSKTVNLNPIIILIGIIIFSHFFGILGMIISTPVLLVIRNIINYYKKNKPKWFTIILEKL